MSTSPDSSLPLGTATFLMTDVEGSTRLHSELPEATLAALRIHDRIGMEAISRHNGHLIKSKGEGDSLFAVFSDAADAIIAAVDFQLELERAAWPDGAHLRVRAALHTGAAEMDDGDYRGVTVNRCARLRGIAHGGQVILSTATKEHGANAFNEQISFKDMGTHRLKDLMQPEQVFQIVHPLLQNEFPSLASLGDRPNNLPVQLTTFVGREKEIETVVNLLQDHRLVTLMGGGGTGKTRLALQIGAELLDSYPGGVFLVELAAIFESELVPHALASALKIREEPGVPMLTTLTTWLKEKKAVLIFDNCEQVAKGAAQTISSLIKSCPKVVVLATSRQALHVTGEYEMRVPSMSSPTPGESLHPDEVLKFESVRLLVERAKSKAPNFKLTPGNVEGLGKLCARLDGIPLCLELVAPKLKLFTPDQLLAKLNDVFRVLTGTSMDEIPRHQTIQATVDWSYQLLSEEERSVLRWLSVFPAGCTIEAAERTCASGLDCEVTEAISQLYDKSMLILEASDDGSMRQRQLATVRAFAAAKLEENGESDAARQAMVAWCMQISREANEAFLTQGDEGVLDGLNAEHDNYRAALEWCLQRPELRAQSLDLAIQLHRYWMRRGHLREGMSWLQTALDTAGGAVPADMRADGLNILGVFAWYQGRLDVAKSSIAESRDLWKAVGNDAKLAATLNNSALLAAQEGDLSSARDSLEEAVETWGRHGDTRHVADGLANLGNLALEAMNYPEAVSYLERSLALKRQLADLWGVAMVLGSLAIAHMLNEDLDTSVPRMLEALRMVRSSKDETLASSSLIEAAYLGLRRGDVKLAARLAGASDAAVERLGIKLNVTTYKLRMRVVQETNELATGGYASCSVGGRALPLQKALDEAIAFVEAPQAALSLN